MQRLEDPKKVVGEIMKMMRRIRALELEYQRLNARVSPDDFADDPWPMSIVAPSPRKRRHKA